MAAEDIQPALILRNGRIATLDGARSFAQAVAVQDGRFLAVGSDEEIMASSRREDRNSSMSAAGL